MRILYAIQGTGNGHTSRALAFLPELMKCGEVDILISGEQADIKLPYPIKFRRKGLGFYFGKSGGVDVWTTIKKWRPLHFIYDLITLPVRDYDVVISDFEPLSAWACQLWGKNAVGLSHQAAFKNPSVPRPERKNIWAEAILRYYAPTQQSIGFHFKKYSHDIFFPIIRPAIQQATPTDRGHILVYLPSYSADHLCDIFTNITEVHWKIYTKRQPTVDHIPSHIELIRAGSPSWIDDLCSASGAIIGAGFEGPSELLYLGKRMMVIPMVNQYEQHCNAAALSEMGIPVIQKLNKTSIPAIKNWLDEDKSVQIQYPDERQNIIQKILFEEISEPQVTFS